MGSSDSGEAPVTTICQKCGRRVPVETLHLETYGFLWMKMRLVCLACYGAARGAAAMGSSGDLDGRIARVSEWATWAGIALLVLTLIDLFMIAGADFAGAQPSLWLVEVFVALVVPGTLLAFGGLFGMGMVMRHR